MSASCVAAHGAVFIIFSCFSCDNGYNIIIQHLLWPLGIFYGEGVEIVATKSMYKSVKISNKHLANSFVRALESAKDFATGRVTPAVKVQDIKKDKIKDFFGDKS